MGRYLPMTYAFRLRFRTAKAFTTDEQRITVLGSEHSSELTIAATPEGTLRNAKWLSVKSGGFGSPEAAREDALKLKDELLLLGAVRYMGFDLGHDQVTSGLFNLFRSQLEEQHGYHIRNNVHGIDVFEEDPERETRFFSFEATGTVSEPPAYFAAFFRRIRAAGLQLTERQRIALELINDSIFPASPDAQLLIRVAAMEVLCQPRSRPEGLRALLSTVLKSLNTVDASPEDKRIVREMLQRGMNESIGQATQRHIRTILGDQREKDFKAIYKSRSRLTHHGRGRGQNAQIAGSALSLAIDLVMAEIGFVPPEITTNETEVPTAERPADGDRQ
jgi:hypothetical protein